MGGGRATGGFWVDSWYENGSLMNSIFREVYKQSLVVRDICPANNVIMESAYPASMYVSLGPTILYFLIYSTVDLN